MKDFDKYLIIFALIGTLTIFGLTSCETLKDFDFSFENKAPDGVVTKIVKEGDCVSSELFDNINKTCIKKKE